MTARGARAGTSTGAPWGRLAPLVAAVMASQALLVVLSPTIASVAADLGTSVAAVGQARSVTAVAAIVTSLVTAKRFDAVGVPRLLAFGSAVGLGACAAMALAPDLTVFIAAHVLVGVAFACLLTGGFSGVAGFRPEERAWAIGYLASANALAWVVVNPLVGGLAQAFGWRVAMATPGLLVAGVLLGARRAARVPCAQTPLPFRILLADPSARRWIGSELTAYAAWTGLLTFVGAYFVGAVGADEALTGWLLAAGAGTYLLASSRSRLLVARSSRRRLVVGSALVMAGLLPVLLNLGAGNLLIALAVFCAVGLMAGVRTPASSGLGLDQAPGHPGAMMAARTAVTQLGYLLGGVVGGAIIATAGWGALGAVLGATMAVSAVLVRKVSDPLERGAAAEGAPRPGVRVPDLPPAT